MDDAYSRSYPVDMPWSHLVWVLKRGDYLESPTGIPYEVSKVTILPLPNEPPLIELRKLDGHASDLQRKSSPPDTDGFGMSGLPVW